MAGTLEARTALDVLIAPRTGVNGLERRRRDRLLALVANARARSPFYRELYAGLPAGEVDLPSLPPVAKSQLMERFDEWVADRRITREGVGSFLADPGNIGRPYLGRYFVCTSSGTTGEPGIFVHDERAIAVFRAFALRIDTEWMTPAQWLALARQGLRWAIVVGTGGHYGGVAWGEFERRRSWWRRRAYRVFSIQQPLAELVRGLNAFDPAILTGYPSVLSQLADEAEAGRLRVRPVLTEMAGETCTSGTHDRIRAQLGGGAHEAYASSECTQIAMDCPQGWLHESSDWVVLEPVQADGSPTPPGEASHTVLLTNLANIVQPFIRYDLGDSIVVRPDPCPCGSPMPAIRVSGRCDDMVHIEGEGGAVVDVLPLALSAVVEQVHGLGRCQLVQVGPSTLSMRLEVEVGRDPELVWERVRGSLAAYLQGLGLRGVEIRRAVEPPSVARSGKFHQVIAAGRQPVGVGLSGS